MSAIATEIIGTLALLAGLLVLWIHAAIGSLYTLYTKQVGRGAVWLLAFFLIFIIMATLIITKVGRFLDWLVS